MCSLLIYLLSLIMTGNQNITESDNTICLPEIEIKDNSVYSFILNDIQFPSSTITKNGEMIYIMSLSQKDGGTLVYIYNDYPDKLDRKWNYIGYATHDNHLIIIIGDDSFNNSFSLSSNHLRINVHEIEPTPFDPDEWLYYVKDNRCYRFSYSIGWELMNHCSE